MSSPVATPARPTTPLPEYPRPAMRRQSYACLNGLWQYAITHSSAQPAAFDGDILVPYPPESPASGVGRVLQPGQWLHYRRSFALPPQPPAVMLPAANAPGSPLRPRRHRLLLHFGAVDYLCAVTVDGKPAGSHRGGYLPFCFDITACLDPQRPAHSHELWVAVQDPTDSGIQARGKQTLAPGGMFYTSVSGIWQTVWLEWVPENHITALRVLPDYHRRTLRLEADTSAPCCQWLPHAVLRDAAGRCIAEDWGEAASCDPASPDACRCAVELAIAKEADFHPWSPQDPYLYTVEFDCAEADAVQSYAAFRTVTVEPDCRGIPRFCLNGQPCLAHGLLDQGYWPQGLYTAPSDEAMAAEIRTARALGFNMLRKHAKVEPQRWYYHCDRLGMLVFQDMPAGGAQLQLWFVTYLTNILLPVLRRLPDGPALWKLLGREDAAGRDEYCRQLRGLVQALGCHPSVVCWTPFNEGWGQFDAAAATALLRALDPTRLVEQASGWYDQGGGDFNSIHNYFYPLRVRPSARCAALSEYGGIAWPCPGHTTRQKSYGYGAARSRAQLARRYRQLMLRTVLPRLRQGLSVLVYTQLTDIEEEVNGILTYDRQKIKIDPAVLRRTATALQQEFARCTGQAAGPGR